QFISVAELEVYESASGGGGGGGGSPVEVTVPPQNIIAAVPNPQGSGGGLAVIHDGDRPPVGSTESLRQYDSWDGNNAASEDWVGYEFATSQNFSKVVFQEGLQ